MSYMFRKKSKISPEPFKKHIYLGIPTNIAAGPLGFRAELDTDPIGNRNRSDHDLAADRPDSSIVMPDENNPRPSRIIFHNKSEDQGLHAPETSTPDAVVDGTEHGDDRTSGCFRCSSSSLYFSLSEENIDDTEAEEGEPIAAIKGTCQCHRITLSVNVCQFRRETGRTQHLALPPFLSMPQRKLQTDSVLSKHC